MPDNRNFQGNRGGYGGDRPRAQALPPVKIDGFYKDDKKNPKDELFDATALNIAQTFFIKDGGTGVTKTQMRRLYDEVKRFENNLDGTPETWSRHYPYIRMIKSKVSYNIARAIKNPDEAGVYKNLSSFLNEGIGLITEEKDYHVFLALFEAVYGFYYDINHKKD